jgi:hypothetical protein
MRCLYADRSQTSIDSLILNGRYFPNKASVRLSFDSRESRREKTHVSSHCWLHKSGGDSCYLVPDEMAFALDDPGGAWSLWASCPGLLDISYVHLITFAEYHTHMQINMNAYGL